MCFSQTEGKTLLQQEYGPPYYKTRFISVVWNQSCHISVPLLWTHSSGTKLSRHLQRSTRVDRVDLFIYLPGAHDRFSVLGWAQQSSVSMWGHPRHSWCEQSPTLTPSRANQMLTIPETWTWDSEMRIRSCSWVYARGIYILVELGGSGLGCVKVEAVEAARCRYNSGANAQWEAKRGYIAPGKRMRKGARFQFLAPISYEDQLHFWYPSPSLQLPFPS